MSRAFVRNDAPEPMVVIPPRPPLPGPVNYVTPRGMALLREELEQLEARRARLASQDNTGQQEAELAIVNGSITELQQRIALAKVIEPRRHDVVRFGSTVSLRFVSGSDAGKERTLTIVGVDEASAAQGRVAFTAPVARAVLGLRVG